MAEKFHPRTQVCDHNWTVKLNSMLKRKYTLFTASVHV